MDSVSSQHRHTMKNTSGKKDLCLIIGFFPFNVVTYDALINLWLQVESC